MQKCVCAGTTNRLSVQRPNITGEVSVAFLPDFWSLRGITDANLCFQACFLENFQLVTSLFYLIIRNVSYFRPKGCCCFYPVSCVFLLHMGLLITTLLILVNVWKTSGKAGDQRVKIKLTNITGITV